MKYKVTIGIILLGLVITAGFFLRHKPTTNFDCSQNTGPFVSVGTPTVTKDEVKTQLLQFYTSCLKPDYDRGYVDGKNSNSESQSYALWQAYLAGDQKTFRTVLAWTNANLKRGDYNLFAWKYEIKNSFFGPKVVIDDHNTATDADTTIAYVLFRAGTDWKNQAYLEEAKSIAKDIWNYETVEVAGKRYAVAGNWANEPQRAVINPSYFFPQAYRTFVIFDGSHDWDKLTADTYELLALISNHGDNHLVIPPNWIQINKPDGSVANYPDKPEAQDFSYDAFRTLWQVSFDQLHSPSFASWNYVSSIKAFEIDWDSSQTLCALYIYNNGDYSCDHSTTSTLAAPIGIMSVTNGYKASQIIQKYYWKDNHLAFPDTDFYAKSWHWFAAWLWSHS